MKKLIMSAALAVLAAGVTAQISFGAHVGGNFANLQGERTESGTTTKGLTKPKFGFLAGVVAVVPVTHVISFRPELNIIQKGYNANYNKTDATMSLASTGEGTFNFIELPLNFVYSFPSGDNTFFLGIGPSVSYGLSGKYNYTINSTISGYPTQTLSGNGHVKFDGKKDSEISASDPDKHIKALDFGGNILAGYKLPNGIYFQAGYTMGFNDIDPNPNSSLKTNGVNVKVGYIFGGNDGH
ncbi:MAG: hypothetical protein JWR61_4935 [Ferruginibacter sp.]|uniref:porin family protein n=1 Tax=Ferruginibacter sp. TaxID=1940288 RepID=UPI002658C1E1|nr:porin family protein [Ferruginibacter sp.]MDB5279980.1 hypothetical protein [Ferruginibacter sp.]